MAVTKLANITSGTSGSNTSSVTSITLPLPSDNTGLLPASAAILVAIGYPDYPYAVGNFPTVSSVTDTNSNSYRRVFKNDSFNDAESSLEVWVADENRKSTSSGEITVTWDKSVVKPGAIAYGFIGQRVSNAIDDVGALSVLGVGLSISASVATSIAGDIVVGAWIIQPEGPTYQYVPSGQGIDKYVSPISTGVGGAGAYAIGIYGTSISNAISSPGISTLTLSTNGGDYTTAAGLGISIAAAAVTPVIPNLPPGFIDPSITGKASGLTCVTRAIKNAKFLQSLNTSDNTALGGPLSVIAGYFQEHLVPPKGQLPAGGYRAVLPFSGSSNINQLIPQPGYGSVFTDYFAQHPLKPPGKAQPGAGGEAASIVSTLALPAQAAAVAGAATGTTQTGAFSTPVFAGTIHLVQLTYQNDSGVITKLDDADVQVILNFWNEAAPVIQQYLQQYGSVSINIDQNIMQETLTISGTGNSFKDQDLNVLCDQIASKLGYTANTTSSVPTEALFFLGAPGVVNSDCDESSNGCLGYHTASDNALIPYGYASIPSTGLTSTDSSDDYQIVCSHELAELSADPTALLQNLEVCDPCGPNCSPLYRDFFDGAGKYLGTQTIFPPLGITYAFFIDAIIAASSISSSAEPPSCGVPPGACSYAPGASSSSGGTGTGPGLTFDGFTIPELIPIPGMPLPEAPNLPFTVPSGVFSILLPLNNIAIGQQATGPLGIPVIQLPLTELPGGGS